ncbi:MAG: hypothetical protein N2255_02835 [Kiritimatiellae bacterium]|nr:hypothetical protein [Kiritimatiellia bacterium]
MKRHRFACRFVRSKLLLQEAQTGDARFDHLSMCQDCHSFAETISTLTVVGKMLRQKGVSPEIARKTRRQVAEILSEPTTAPIPSRMWAGTRIPAAVLATLVLAITLFGFRLRNVWKTPDPQASTQEPDEAAVSPSGTEWETAERLAENLRSDMRAFRSSLETGATDNFATRLSALSLRVGEVRHNLEVDLHGVLVETDQM